MKKVATYLLAILLAVFTVSCGGGGGGGSSSSTSATTTPTSTTLITHGTVYDDKIANLSYATNGYNSYTDLNGQFEYKSGEIRFYLGTMFLGSVSSMPDDKKVFLSDMLNLPRGTYDNEKLIKLARILQALDSQPSNDSSILLDSDKVNEIFSSSSMSVEDFDLDTLNDNGYTVPTEEEALKEVKSTYVDEGITTTSVNKPPVANAGESVSISQSKGVTLDGSGSTDSDGTIVSYKWYSDGSLIYTGETFTINSLSAGVHKFTLKVTDDDGSIDTDVITVTVSGDGSATVVSDKTDDIVFEVVSTVPQNDAREVSRTSPIVINFSLVVANAIDSISLKNVTDDKTVSLSSGDFSYTNGGKTVVINKTLSSDRKTYILTIAKTTKDKTGGTLGDDKNVVFYTSDTLSPEVSSVTPANGATSVATNQSIDIIFSEKVSTSTLSGITLKQGSTSKAYNIDTTQNPTITIIPKGGLDEESTYTLNIPTSVQDLEGNALKSAASTTFSTSDETAPTVTQSGITIAGNALSNGDTDVPINQAITITFSEEIDSSSVTKTNITLNNGATYTLSLSSDKKSIIVNPTLQGETTYNLIVKNIKDVNGNSLPYSTSTIFTTEDNSAPKVTKVIASGVELSSTSKREDISVSGGMMVTFNEPIKNVTASSVTLSNASSANVLTNSEITISTDSKSIVINPTKDLEYNTDYTLSLTTGITDENGNALNGTQTYEFETEDVLDVIPPTTNIYIDGKEVADSMDKVSLASKVTVVFSEKMNTATVLKTSVRLNEQGSTSNINSDNAFSYDDDTNTATVNLSKILNNNSYGKTYTLTVTSAKDTSGNEVMKNVASFTVAPSRVYRDADNNVTYDYETGLVWQDNSGAKDKYATWDTANDDICPSLELAGYSDWRIPTEEQLVGIKAIISNFKNIASEKYWTSTILSTDTNQAAFVQFGSTNNGYDLKTSQNYIRCVRGVE